MIATESLVLVMFITHRRILDSLKARITYPRTGYVRPPADFPSKHNSLDTILTLGTAHQIDENVSSFRSNTVQLFITGFLLVLFLEVRWSLPLVMTAIAAAVYFLNRNDVRPYSWRAVLPIALAGFFSAGLDAQRMAGVAGTGHWRCLAAGNGNLDSCPLSSGSPQLRRRSGSQHMNAQIKEVAQLDRLIHEPARLMIMMILQGTG